MLDMRQCQQVTDAQNWTLQAPEQMRCMRCCRQQDMHMIKACGQQGRRPAPSSQRGSLSPRLAWQRVSRMPSCFITACAWLRPVFDTSSIQIARHTQPGWLQGSHWILSAASSQWWAPACCFRISSPPHLVKHDAKIDVHTVPAGGIDHDVLAVAVPQAHDVAHLRSQEHSALVPKKQHEPKAGSLFALPDNLAGRAPKTRGCSSFSYLQSKS